MHGLGKKKLVKEEYRMVRESQRFIATKWKVLRGQRIITNEHTGSNTIDIIYGYREAPTKMDSNAAELKFERPETTTRRQPKEQQ
jgi:hypothetical protein